MTPRGPSAPKPIVLLAAVCVAVASYPGALPAQAASSDSAGGRTIDGFGGVRWGADRAAVVAAVGPPDTVRRIEAMGARALVYADRSLGRTRGSLGYLVHPADGLLRVLYLSGYGSGEVCLEMYQNLRDTVAEMYPDLSRRERMYNESEDLAFCTAFQLGQAGARTIWKDRRTGARAWVALDLEAGVVRVSFESPSYEPRPAEADSGERG